tara:strand:+ start:306 stop:791 length:486 start_codon:yes stop_codon:yes gene_type:complete
VKHLFKKFDNSDVKIINYIWRKKMSEEIKKFFTTYTDFVTKVTSDPSIELDALKKSFNDIEEKSDIKTPRLLTAALGLGSETGEFVEIVKKMFLQGKPPSDDNVFHMKRELGDIMWYWVTACAALNLDPYEVISENQEKLAARYGEKFEIDRSEIRKEGDL